MEKMSVDQYKQHDVFRVRLAVLKTSGLVVEIGLDYLYRLRFGNFVKDLQ